MYMKGYFIGWVFVIALCMAIIPNDPISADTNVSGYISADTTWTSANSPYVVTGNIVVKSGITLTIEPGITVKTDSGKSIQVDGTLITKGTSASKITFTKNSSSNWGYILFSDSSTDAAYDTDGNYTSGSILEYCVVEYAGGASVSDNGAVRINGAHPLINYCTIKNNAASGIYVWSLSEGTGTLKITNNTISNNSASNGGGIYSSASTSNSSSTVTISGNTISNNTASSEGGGIYSYSSSGYSSTVAISGNTISNNTASSNGGGIYSSCSGAYYAAVTISGNTIRNNTASSNGGGIYSYSYSEPAYYITISGNTISNNTASSSGGGIYTDGGNVTVSKNGLTVNSAKNASAVYYSKSDNEDFTDFTYNTIMGNKATYSSNTYTVYINSNYTFNYSNIFSNTSTYELWNGNSYGSSNLDAKNNWWGTTDDSTIQGKIYDWIDDTTKGLVDYSPFETTLRTDCPISPPTGLTATAGSGQITLSWSANSESDTAGYKVYWDTDSSHSYTNAADAGNVTSYTITNLADGKYYVTVTAYDTTYSSASDDASTVVNENQTSGNESWYAEEKSVTLGTGGGTTPTPLTTPIPSPTPEQVVSGKIYGNVVNIKGNPIEFVRLRLKGIKTKVIKTASSDADGFFEFTDLEADTYVIIAKKKKYRNAQQKVKLEEGESTEIEIVMKKTSKRVIEMMEDGQ
ncbi:MAG: hypothetical protein A2Y09_04135 [Planctomycetes bacterium GWA2_39_15]|nr:MAG: hypothetical protein A2Y09_04135 [Planctomycetes bacterium GWA2_39_15]